MFQFIKKLFTKKVKLALGAPETEALSQLAKKGFNNLSEENKRRFLDLSAKDFANKFRGLIKRLANE